MSINIPKIVLTLVAFDRSYRDLQNDNNPQNDDAHKNQKVLCNGVVRHQH